MDKRCGIVIVSVTIFVLCFIGTASATNWSVDGSGGADFTEIQDAINSASTGDTILVYSGIYYENVVVDKSVTLKGIDHPVVDAGGRESAITLTADGITLLGFNARNSGSFWWGNVGIMVTSNNNTITGNNVCNNNYDGIFLWGSSNNTITGNNVCNNSIGGIILRFSSNKNRITGNNVCNNNRSGICLCDSSNKNRITGNNVCNNDGGISLHYYSNNNTITGNNICNNSYGIDLSFSSNNNTITGNVFVNDGLSVDFSYQNTVEDNTVNGKPLVYLEDVSDYKVKDAGQVILVNCNNITVGNLDLSNTDSGIELWKTENSKISNNTVCNNNWGGISLYDSSSKNTITGNNVSNNDWCGILLSSSSNNSITGNNVSNNYGGISIHDSSKNTITGNNVSNNNQGDIRFGYDISRWIGTRLWSIRLWGGIGLYDSSSKNTITGNNVSNNNYAGIRLWVSTNNNTITGNVFVNNGLSVYSSYQNTMEDNTVNGKPLVYLEDVSNYKVEDAGQVILVNCDNITIDNLDLSNTDVGIELWRTENSTISNNTVRKNRDGICLYSSSNNNTITGNNVSNNNASGIDLIGSSNNTITGNNVCNNRYDGISLSSSSSNITITGNVFVNDGLFIYYSSYQNTVEDNTVNGKPLVYLKDVSDYKVEDAGQVIIVNCNNITIEDLDLSNTSVGIALWKTENSKISSNTVCNNNRCGIRLDDSSNNSITGNNVSNNNESGIDLIGSSNNTITGNNVSNNRYDGIRLFHSRNNKIYFNNFIDNSRYINSYESTNIWNSPLVITYTYDGTTYKSYLGNYCDDYEGTDADGDGIGDIHYSIPESDVYPLMKPFENYILLRAAPA